MTLDEAIAALRERNEPVPNPLRVPTEQQVSAAEQELGVRFHPDLRAFFLRAGDIVFGTLEPVTLADPEAHTHLPALAQSAWEEAELPRTLLPICEDNGDYYCMNRSGEVLFWSHNGATEEKWADLATWIKEVWIGENAA